MTRRNSDQVTRRDADCRGRSTPAPPEMLRLGATRSGSERLGATRTPPQPARAGMDGGDRPPAPPPTWATSRHPPLSRLASPSAGPRWRSGPAGRRKVTRIHPERLVPGRGPCKDSSARDGRPPAGRVGAGGPAARPQAGGITPHRRPAAPCREGAGLRR